MNAQNKPIEEDQTTLAGDEASDQTENATEVAPRFQPEITQSRLASGLGHRSTRTAQILGRANKWFGLADDKRVRPPEEPTSAAETEQEPLAAEDEAVDEADLPEETVAPGPTWTKGRPVQSGIGRGGVTAIAMLVVFVPLIVLLLYTLYDSTVKLDGLQRTLREFNGSLSLSGDAQFVSLLTDPGLQRVPFVAEDRAPNGSMVLYAAGRLRWGISYGRLDPLGPNQAYIIWLESKTKENGQPIYQRLQALPDIRSASRAVVIKESDFPQGFNVQSYTQLLVTVEAADQVVEKPSGPRRFSLNLGAVRA